MRQRLTKRRHDRKRTWNRNTDKNYEVCLQITSRFGLAKVIVSVKRTRVLENISEILTVSSSFTLFHYVLNKIFNNCKAFIGYRCFGAFWSANNLPWPWPCTTDLASYLLTKWQFWQLTLKWLSRARAQDKNQIILLLFFFLQDFIQLCDSRIRDSCEIGFRVQFNAEFPRQVMNFPIHYGFFTYSWYLGDLVSLRVFWVSCRVAREEIINLLF